MATRIEQILKRARVILSDKEIERWPDSDLLLHLDEGHKDLCQHSQLLQARHTVDITAGDPYIQLPADCWMLTRVTFRGSAMPFITHTQLDSAELVVAPSYNVSDAISDDWQEDVGTPSALVYDRRNANEARLYPIPSEETEQTHSGSLYGCLISASTYTTDSSFGVGVAYSDQPDLDPFGVTVSITELPAAALYYIQIPADITEVTDSLVTPTMFDTALKYYVVAQAFLTDLNEEYQAKGIQQLQFYNRELDLAQKSAQRDNQRAAASRTTYRRVV